MNKRLISTFIISIFLLLMLFFVYAFLKEIDYQQKIYQQTQDDNILDIIETYYIFLYQFLVIGYVLLDLFIKLDKLVISKTRVINDQHKGTFFVLMGMSYVVLFLTLYVIPFSSFEVFSNIILFEILAFILLNTVVIRRFFVKFEDF